MNNEEKARLAANAARETFQRRLEGKELNKIFDAFEEAVFEALKVYGDA